MILIPYGTEKDDGFIGYLSIAIIAVCMIAFVLTWPPESRLMESIQRDSVQTWMQRDREAFDTMSTLDQIEWVRRTSRQIPGFHGMDTSAFQEVAQAQRALGVEPQAEASEGADLPTIPERVERTMKEKSLLRRWGLHPGDASWFPGILTHMFLHSGWMHLIGNMVFFFAFGVALERRFGGPAFLLLYLGGGFAAALAQVGVHSALFRTLPSIPLVGASGAIAATMGAFLHSMPKTRIKVFAWFLRPIAGRIPAWIFLLSWFAMELLRNHFLSPVQQGGTAYAAHVGGFAFGFIVSFFLPVDPDVAEAERPKPARAALYGFDGFASASAPVVKLPPIDQAWDCMRTGDETTAKDLFVQQFREWSKGGEPEQARLSEELDKLAKRHPHFQLEPLPAWELGMALSQTEHVRAAAELLRMSLSGPFALPASMTQRAEQTLDRLRPIVYAKLEERIASSSDFPVDSSVFPAETVAIPRVGTAAGIHRKEHRPSWLVD